MTVEACGHPIGAASFLSNRRSVCRSCTVLLRPEVSTDPQRLSEWFRLPAPHLPPDRASAGLSLLQWVMPSHHHHHRGRVDQL